MRLQILGSLDGFSGSLVFCPTNMTLWPRGQLLLSAVLSRALSAAVLIFRPVHCPLLRIRLLLALVLKGILMTQISEVLALYLTTFISLVLEKSFFIYDISRSCSLYGYVKLNNYSTVFGLYQRVYLVHSAVILLSCVFWTVSGAKNIGHCHCAQSLIAVWTLNCWFCCVNMKLEFTKRKELIFIVHSRDQPSVICANVFLLVVGMCIVLVRGGAICSRQCLERSDILMPMMRDWIKRSLSYRPSSLAVYRLMGENKRQTAGQ